MSTRVAQTGPDLVPALTASVAYVREAKRQGAKRIRMSENSTIVVHRDVSGPLEFSSEQIQLMRDAYAPGATEVEFKTLLEISRLRRLNPFLKQIQFIKRKARDDNNNWREFWMAQVTIDGLRAIAERTGLYAGQDEPEFERNKDGLILSARVRVYRKDWQRPSVGTARWDEYVQVTRDGSPTKFWATMPHTMIGKCAEALALRKAFPEDLGGLYTEEEMQQSDNAQHQDVVHLSPHTPVDELPDAGLSGDAAAFMATATRILEKLKSDVAYCRTWEELQALRAIAGTKSKQSELTRRMQEYGPDKRIISGAQFKELSKLWQHCDRQLTALEAKLKPPSVEASFIDPPDDADGTEAFAPERERQPGEDDD